MSLMRDQNQWEDAERAHTAQPYVPYKAERLSAQRIGLGSFACPQCDVPVTLGGPVALSGRMRCPFCRGIHPVRSFVHLDTADTSLNVVELRARLPH
jgi:hypothetical protein